MESAFYSSSHNVLRLQDISISDFLSIEQIAIERFCAPLAEETAPVVAAGKAFDRIPRIFTGLEHWPQSTNLRCWQCTFTFDGPPKFVPTFVRETDQGVIEFGVKGNMCSFNCVELWITSRVMSIEERRRLQQNLLYLYFIFTGRLITHIAPNPDKCELQQYGGDMNEDKFLAKMQALSHAETRNSELDKIIRWRPRGLTPPEAREASLKSLLKSRDGTSIMRCPAEYPPGSGWELNGFELKKSGSRPVSPGDLSSSDLSSSETHPSCSPLSRAGGGDISVVPAPATPPAPAKAGGATSATPPAPGGVSATPASDTTATTSATPPASDTPATPPGGASDVQLDFDAFLDYLMRSYSVSG